jgi:hypothetical protein
LWLVSSFALLGVFAPLCESNFSVRWLVLFSLLVWSDLCPVEPTTYKFKKMSNLQLWNKIQNILEHTWKKTSPYFSLHLKSCFLISKPNHSLLSLIILKKKTSLILIGLFGKYYKVKMIIWNYTTGLFYCMFAENVKTILHVLQLTKVWQCKT